MTLFFFCKVSYRLLVDYYYPYFRLNKTRLVEASYGPPVKRYHRRQVSYSVEDVNASDDDDDGFFLLYKVAYGLLVDSDYPYYRLNLTRLVAASYGLPDKRYHRPQVSCLCLRCITSDDDDFFVCKGSYRLHVDSDYPYFRLNQTRLVAAL